MSKQEKFLTPRMVLILLVFIVGVPMLPLVISWQWGWWEAWAYAVVNVLGFVVSRYLAIRENPDLLAERGRFMKQDNTESWDKKLSPLLGLSGALIPLAAGLDARFVGTVDFALWIRLLALALMIAGYAFGAYALIANRYFSAKVRVQSDRDHQVVTSGPYRWVRHPGYAGAVLSYMATPFLLESLWTFVLVALTVGVLVTRTFLEDRTLQVKLEGYQDYVEDVRYRLIPGVW